MLLRRSTTAGSSEASTNLRRISSTFGVSARVHGRSAARMRTGQSFLEEIISLLRVRTQELRSLRSSLRRVPGRVRQVFDPLAYAPAWPLSRTIRGRAFHPAECLCPLDNAPPIDT